MAETENKASLENITFDDVVFGDGAETQEAPAKAEAEEIKEASNEAEELDKDAEKKEAESKPEEEEQVEKEEVEEEIEEDVEEGVEEEAEDKSKDTTVVGEILSKLGYEVEEDYDDTTEGLLKLTQDVGQKLAEDQMGQLFNKFPLIQQHLEYVLSGGDSQEFMKAYDPQLDYDKITISEDDARSQKAILSNYFSTKGHDEAFVKEMVDDYEDSGKLYQKAEAAKKALATMQVKQRQELVKSQKEQQEKQLKKQDEFWNGVYETLEKNQEFAGLSVPVKEKSKFFDYLSKPVTQEGHTQRDLDHSDASLDVKLAIDYLMYKGFNLDKIINTKVKTKKAQSLRDKISKNQETVKSARKVSRKKGGSVDVEDLNLDLFR